MELRQLRYFQAVVEAGSLSAAAAKLHISQPPLSVAISKLEAELGVSLLVRTPRGVNPTTAGRYLIDASSRLLNDADEIASTLSKFGSGLQGIARLATVPVLMWSRVPRLLKHFAATNPEVEVQLTATPPWIALEMLEQHRVDIAIIMVTSSGSFFARHQDAFNIEDWGPVPLVAVLPPDRADAPDPLPLSALQHDTFIMPPRAATTPSLTDLAEQYFQEEAIVPEAFRQVETISSGLPLIEAGLAVGLLPDPGYDSLQRFDVVTRHLDPRPDPLRMLILTRRDEEPEPALLALLERLRDLTLPEDDSTHSYLGSS